jgi:hypothetical protein
VINDRVIEVTAIFFLTEQFGDNYDPNGMIVKVKYRARFERKVNGVSPGYTTYNGVAQVFTADQNPLSDTPVAVVELESTTASRLQAD